MAVQVPACVTAFILAILCSNPILKGAWTTLLNGMILQLSLEIDLLTLQIERLNIINSITSIGITTLRAVVNKVAVDLNLFLGPLQQFSDCTQLSDINSIIQSSAVGKTVSALNKKLYDLNRATNLVNIQNAIKQKKEQKIQDLQNFLNAILTLCP